MSTEGSSKNCEHYVRKCRLVSPCCDKVYTCRFCHDENETHKLVRSNVKQIECLQCETRQEVSSNCKSCLIAFGKYFCAICCLFDDRDKGQFHCDGCGICRVGGKDKFFHCDKCDMCLSRSIMDTHKCIEKCSRNNCAICLEDLHTSTITSHVPDCGHLLHGPCFRDLLKSGGYTCPMCNKCLVDMSSAWRKLDVEIAETPMPGDYANLEVKIVCRDCHKCSKVKFHIVGLKCEGCGSYNTSRDDAGDMPEFPVDVAANIQIQMRLEQLEELTDSEEHEDESEGEDDEDVPDGDEQAMEDVGELQVLLDILGHNDESEGEVYLDENAHSLTSDTSDSNSIGSDLSLD